MTDHDPHTLQDGVPAYLETPPVVEPPVTTLAQVLPCASLEWRNFERLCVRIVRLEGEIEHSQLYGTPGQAQQGIDLFARATDATYRVYQCKRVKDFGATDLKTAVTDFLKGTWAKKAKKFVVCTSESGVKTQIAEECEVQAQVLKDKDISFELWDAETISTRLKDHPQLVHDFFGKEWLRVFSGEEVFAALRARIEPTVVGDFRRLLHDFLWGVFNEQDPGIPLQSATPGVDRIPITERFVFPDILMNEDVVALGLGYTEPRTSEPSAGNNIQTAEARSERFTTSGEQAPQNWMQGQARRRRSLRSRRSYRIRKDLDRWLSQPKNSLITGGPGIGKSALLRYLVLDILSDAPKHGIAGSGWGERLPIFIPFAFWTKRIADTGSFGLTECIKQWLSSWSQLKLWPVVERALEDERLLLFIDGLDEWTNEQAGNVAIQLLQVFVLTHKARVIATSRPNPGLSVHGSEWQTAELAELSWSQQAELIQCWFYLKNRFEVAQGGLALSDEAIKQHAQDFLDQISDSPDLDELGKVPLLLTLLIFLRFRDKDIPEERFDAYKEVVDYLIKKHPVLKRAASLTGDMSTQRLRERDLRSVLNRVAYEIHAKFPEGIISEEELTNLVEKSMAEPDVLGLHVGETELRQYSEQFSRTVEGASGLLVKQGTDAYSFLHRSIGEFLAAAYIASKSIAFQKQIVDEHADDPRWREVILGLLWTLNRPQEVVELVNELKSKVNDRSHSGLAVRELLAEAIFGDVQCPGVQARELATQILETISGHEWIPHRRRLLRFVVRSGLRSSRTRDIVQARLPRWIFRASGWRSFWFNAIGSWPYSVRAFRALCLALNDEDSGTKLAAAFALSAIGRGRTEVAAQLRQYALYSLDVDKRAAALAALSDWPAFDGLLEAIEKAQQRAGSVAEMTIAAVYAKIKIGSHTHADLSKLIGLASGEWPVVKYAWKSEMVRCFILGWKGDETLKRACLLAARAPFAHGNHIEKETGLRVLLQAFPQDREVAEYCINQIRDVDHPFLFLDMDAWRYITVSFEGHAEVAEAIDERVEKKQMFNPELSFAAQVGKTAKMKQKLIEGLNQSLPFWAVQTLLKCWGMNDPEVSVALEQMAYGPPAKACAIAKWIPQIVSDPKFARAKLLELLEGPDSGWHHLVMAGLGELKDRGDEGEIVRSAFKAKERGPMRRNDEFDAALISGFYNVLPIRDFAKESLKQRDPLVSTVAAAYPSDPEMQNLVLELITPLPVEMRSDVIEMLSTLRGDSLSLGLLARYDVETEDEIKTAASIAFHRRAHREMPNVDDVVQNLGETLKAYGHDFEDRRRAAFAGLLVLGRANLLTGNEPFNPTKLLSISLGRFMKPNVPLVSLLAKHWHELVALFGDTLEARMTGHLSSVSLDGAIATVADRYPDVQRYLLDKSQTKTELRHEPAFLRMLSAVYPKSDLLKRYCLEALRRDDGTWGAYERVQCAADVLVDNFAGDTDMLNQIVEYGKQRGLVGGEVIALCAGWPTCKPIDVWYEELQRPDRGPVPAPQLFAITYARVPSERFPTILAGHLQSVKGANSYQITTLSAAVARRAKRDASVRDQLFTTLMSSSDADVKATVPRILSQAGDIRTELVEWTKRELLLQLSYQDTPDVGFDLTYGADRSVALSLLEVVED